MDARTRKLTLDDITDLRAYERERDAYRQTVIELKARRRVAVGPIVSLVFENRETMRSQIQEMARAERMVTDEQIQKELDVYNALIPAPGELSATLFIELTAEEALRNWLPRLVGIEHSVILRLPGRTRGSRPPGPWTAWPRARWSGPCPTAPTRRPSPGPRSRRRCTTSGSPSAPPGWSASPSGRSPSPSTTPSTGPSPCCPKKSGPSSSPTSGPDRMAPTCVFGPPGGLSGAGTLRPDRPGGAVATRVFFTAPSVVRHTSCSAVSL